MHIHSTHNRCITDGSTELTSEAVNSNKEMKQVPMWGPTVWLKWVLLVEGNDEPDSLLILAEEELVAVDLLTPGWPLYRLPYINSIHASSIVSASHINNVPHSLWERIMIAGCCQHTSFSPRVCSNYCWHSVLPDCCSSCDVYVLWEYEKLSKGHICMWLYNYICEPCEVLL